MNRGESDIRKSLKKITFAEDVLYGRIVRGSFENPEYYSQVDVLVRNPKRKDRGIRKAYKKNGHKAPELRIEVENDVNER